VTQAHSPENYLSRGARTLVLRPSASGSHLAVVDLLKVFRELFLIMMSAKLRELVLKHVYYVVQTHRRFRSESLGILGEHKTSEQTKVLIV
jgi:hypothetical protein